MRIQVVWEKANSLRGCLSHLRTTSSRRRFPDSEEPLEMSDDFLSDQARLLSSKTFRILSDKTQVFTFPPTPLIRSRKSHVMEVVACSIVVSDMLGLNTNLVQAAAIGHDIGHVPFGHQGESWMAKAMGRNEFCHEVMGPIIVQKIERAGKGLNLTWHTMDAMMRHSGNMATDEMSQEAWVLRHADKFAYIFHDWNDIVGRMGYQASQELHALIDDFGQTQRERTTTAMAGLIIESHEMGRVSFEESELGAKFKRLRNLMYKVYPRVTQQNVSYTLEPVLEFLQLLDICDPFLLLALMTDKDVECLARENMKDLQAFKRTAVSEIAPNLKRIGQIDLCNPDLNW
jgi:dGTPase